MTTTLLNSKNNINTETIKDMYSLALYDTYKQIQKLYSKNAHSMLKNLLNEYGQAKIFFNQMYIIELLTHAEHKHSINKKNIAELRKIINRVTTTDEIKAEAEEEQSHRRAEQNSTATDIDILEQALQITACNLANLVQEYTQSYIYDTPTAKAYARAEEHYNMILSDAENHSNGTISDIVITAHSTQHSKHTYKDTYSQTHTERTATNAGASATVFLKHYKNCIISDLAHRRTAKATVTRTINKLDSVSTLDQLHTDKKTATAEQLQKWLADGHRADKDYYIEQKNGTRKSLYYSDKDGCYIIVTKRKTIKQANSLEIYKTENGESTIKNISDTDNIYIDSFGALERVETLINKCNLTDRERIYIKALCSRTALYVEIKAHQFYYDKNHDKMNYKKLHKKCNDFAFRMRKKYALEQIFSKDTAQDTKNKFLKRLYQKLSAPYKTMTSKSKFIKHNGEYIKLFARDNNYYNYMMITNHGTAQATPSHKNMLQWIDYTDTATATDTAVIDWLTSEQAEQLKAEHKAEERRQRANTRIDNSTAENMHRAETSHAVYILKQATGNSQFIHTATAEELQTACKQLEKHRAKAKAKAEQEQRRKEQSRRKAQQERITDYKKTAVYNFMYSKVMTNSELEQFKKLTLKQQYNKMCMINFINGFITCHRLNGSELEQFKKLSLKEQYRTAKQQH